MSIDPFAEEVLPFAAAARRLPPMRNGRPISPATLWRWAAHGVRCVRLETCKVGGTTCTSVEALRRFFAALEGRPQVAAPTAQREAAAHRAAAELERLGI